MRTIYILLLTFVVVFAAALSTPVYGQYYISLEQKDPSGVDIAPFQAELNTAAQKLCVLFDSLGFQNKFKVFSAGFYVPQEAYKGYGYPDAFDKLKARAALASDYYLLIGRESNSDGVFGRFWVDLKLPETGNFECFKTLEQQVLRMNLSNATTTHFRTLNTPILYRMTEIAAMDLFMTKVRKVVTCCASNGTNTAACVDCPTAEEIRQLMHASGFVAIPCNLLAQVNKPNTPNPENMPNQVIDYSNMDIEMIGTTFSAEDSMTLLVDGLGTSQISSKGVITKNSSICYDSYGQIKQDFDAGNEQIKVWWHLWENPQPDGVDTLFEYMSNFNLFITDQLTKKLDDFGAKGTKDCAPTNRLALVGSTRWNGTVESWMVQLDYIYIYRPIMTCGEYQIPGAGKNGGPGYADIVDTFFYQMYEVKPASVSNVADAKIQVERYVQKANVECRDKLLNPLDNWSKGNVYPADGRILFNPKKPNIPLLSKLVIDGVITYEDAGPEQKPVEEPVYIPETTRKRLERVYERLKETDPDTWDKEIGLILRRDPELARFIRNAIIGTAIVVVVGTILEDVLTYGAGIVNDFYCFLMAYRLVAVALTI
jgi:hypothetical protein